MSDNAPAANGEDDPYKTTGTPQPSNVVSGTTDPTLPTSLGRYRVEKLLGRGGFGEVFLGHDDKLRRAVAIKVPRRGLLVDQNAVDSYLAEARVLASLDHSHIVPVFDVGTEGGSCFVVSKFIEGTDLAHRIHQSRPSALASAELVATVAEALHYAHLMRLVHRDVKPGNILLDRDDKAYVADFGLALKEQDFGKGSGFAGTPAYMSPEQARGEGHRVDGRSDIFSLGVVFYELLTGQRPFQGDTKYDLLEQITSVEARPPRQIDDTIPRELERICLKAISKRASERYTTAKDFAEDLRHFLTEASKRPSSFPEPDSQPTSPITPTLVLDPATPTPASPVTPSDQPPLKIVPKGLRSFDAHDADFFLELLPGPRDRDGLPDSIRFWKTRIEETDADKTFTVGLIYGPSGCGKSSLMKAGLLPRLPANVIPIYIEATAGETEARFMKGLRKQCPDLPADLEVKHMITALRRGRGVPAGKKVLLVLDQFEQWLHAYRGEENSDLAQALRQCDGERVQCIVMVRDDFWMAATRFMRELEVRLVEGHNSAAVDLFEIRHARRVLAAFGRAFGALSEGPSKLPQDQELFLDQAVTGLSQENKVISVRLALFAEMVKGKPWTPATLKEVGGTEGVGITFLEETFTSRTAPPQHRIHQKAAQAVLKTLLPETGSDIKGNMRSQQDLLEASGYSQHPKDFEELLHILDGEIRLITPTDPEGLETDQKPESPGEKYYQLTHDYLVPSLRDWLTRKQKETRRGRAELLLADRAAVWNGRPENRQLPSLWQWTQIRWWTRKKNWTPPQRKMMRRARTYHAVRGLTLAVLLGVMTFTGLTIRERVIERENANHAAALVARVFEANILQVPDVVKEMAKYRTWTDPLLKQEKEKSAKDGRMQLHASIALLPVDPAQVNFLYGRLLTSQAEEIAVIREALLGHQTDLTTKLWTVLENRQNDQAQRLRAACALALFAPDEPRWEKSGGDVAGMLLMQESFVINRWTDILKDAGRWLIPALSEMLVDEKRSSKNRRLVAMVYRSLAADVPEAYSRLEQQLSVKSDPNAITARKQASLGAALMAMGRAEKAWPLLKHSPDPTIRSILVERLAAGGIDHNTLLSRLKEEKEVSVRRAILLSLCGYGPDQIPHIERVRHITVLLALYRDDPDPGIHSAAERLLREWGAEAKMREIDKTLATGQVAGERRWYLTTQGQTMVVVVGPVTFRMGSPPDEVGRSSEGKSGEEQHLRRINRSFAIASKEVTVDEFLRFRQVHQYRKTHASTGDCPVNSVTWYDAAAYCNWLSEQDGIPKEQWCYKPNEHGQYATGMKMATAYLSRIGYRLPTEGEWEYACRAGTATAYSCGNQQLLDYYGWYSGNSKARSHPVGILKPNELGLFDMHGNIMEWCQDSSMEDPKREDGKEYEDKEDIVDFAPYKANRVLRGGSFDHSAAWLRSAYRPNSQTSQGFYANGFRPSRTLPLGSFTAIPATP